MRVSRLGIRNFFHARIRVALFLGLALRDPLFAFFSYPSSVTIGRRK
jgi:hypothetical protein